MAAKPDTDTVTETIPVTATRLALICVDLTSLGTFFGATWVKRTNGELRSGTFRNSKTMTAGKTGKGSSYNPAEKGLMVVFDTQLKQYRSIDLEALRSVRVSGKEYVLAGQ